MKLINTSKNGTQKFQLKDGRFILSYTSGYVRIDSGLDRLYQINKKIKVKGNVDYLNYYERVLIPCPQERFQYIVDWVDRNVKDIPYSVQRELKNKTSLLNYYRNKYDY